MKNLLIVIALCYTSQMLFAQKVKMGQIKPEELKATTYSKDPSAHAYYIFDSGSVEYPRFESSIGFEFKRHFAIKMLDKEGADQNAIVVIEMHSNGKTYKENVKSLKAVTYNIENGQTVEYKLEKANIFEEKIHKYLYVTKFTLPNVKAGSVIEVSYTLESRFWYLPEWYFQYDIPVASSEFHVDYPNYLIFNQNMRGYEQVTSRVEKGTKTSDFTECFYSIKDVPSFPKLINLYAKEDYLTKISFELISTNFYGDYSDRTIAGSWTDVSKNFKESDDFGEQLRRFGFLKDKTKEITAGLTTEEEKMRAIFTYVQQNFVWNKRELLFCEDMKKLYDSKTGSSNEISLLLTNMLRSADILANPVLMSTRENGFILGIYPTIEGFNYGLVKVLADGKEFVLDACDPYAEVNMIPPYAVNGKGFVINKETTVEWVDLKPASTKGQRTYALAIDDKKEVLQGTVNETLKGYLARSERKAMANAKTKEKFVEVFEERLSNTEINNLKIDNEKDLTKNLSFTYDITFKKQMQKAGDLIYIDANPIPEFSENPFKLEERKYPIEFEYPYLMSTTINIKIPDTYKVESLPKNAIIQLVENGGKYSYTTKVENNIIQISLLMQIGKMLYLPTDYKDIKTFIDMIIAKNQEKIILKKI